MLNANAPQVLLEDSGLPARRYQRIAFPLTITVDKGATFPQQVGVTATLGRYSCTATIRLTAQPVPFMQDGPTPWLSVDVAAFQVKENETAFGQTLAAGMTGPQFIQQALDAIRHGQQSGWETEFVSLRDGPRSTLELSEFVPGTQPPVRTLNFSLARVRNADPLNTATNFSVFFRLFNTAWTGFEYDPGQAYRTAGAAPVAVLGVKTGPGEGGALVAVPCFADGRVTASAPPSTQTDPFNFADPANANEIAPSGTQVFGCWLDINENVARYPQFPGTQDGGWPAPLTRIQDLIRGRHQCLVVEIFRPGDPIPVGTTPGGTDRMSQRNLFIVGCDNPGPPAAHLIQHTFEIKAPLHRRHEVGVEDHSVRGFEPADELVLFADTLPAGTRVRLMFGEIPAEHLLEGYAEQLGGVAFRRVDARTVEFDPGPITTIALPAGITRNLPGLLSFQIPEGVRAGQEFRCRLQQWSEGRVLGQFEVRIPVATRPDLLLEEENKLAVFKSIHASIRKDDPWREVMDAYVAEIADRVGGLGGDPSAIHPSSGGYPGPRPKGCLHRIARLISRVLLALAALLALGKLAKRLQRILRR
jgi:hypothetical protein